VHGGGPKAQMPAPIALGPAAGTNQSVHSHTKPFGLFLGAAFHYFPDYAVVATYAGHLASGENWTKKISLTSHSLSSSQTTRRSNRAPTVKTRLASAYALMEITAEQVANAPKIEHLFRRIGGRVAALRYLESSEEPEAEAIIKLCRKLPKYWVRQIPLEAYALAVKISTGRLFGLIAQELMDESEKVVELLTRARHPEVVQKTIQMALKPSGVKDRQMLHKATGFLPTPKNSFTLINNRAHIDTRSMTKVAVLPPIEMVARQLMESFREIVPPQLPVPAEMPADEDGVMVLDLCTPCSADLFEGRGNRSSDE